MTAVAAVLTALAVAAVRPTGATVLRTRRVRGAPTRSLRVSPRSMLVPVVAVAPVGLLLLPRPSWVLCGLAAAVALGTAALVALRSRAASVASRSQARVVDAVSLLGAELRAGSVVGAALGSVAAEIDELEPVARAARAGGDVEGELRRLSQRPGQGLLADLATAWHVADRGGAPLSAVLERLAAHGRDQVDLEAEVAAELAPARATARVLAVLPVAGIALGASTGGDPVGVVLDTTVGAGCVLAGVVLAGLGILWIERLTAR